MSVCPHKNLTRGQSELAKAAPNDPAHTVRAAECRMNDRLTDWLTDTAIIGNNSLHLMHSMQPKTTDQNPDITWYNYVSW